MSRPDLLVVLAATMMAATFALVVYGVLAAELREAFGLERWQIGALVTATNLVAAAISPAVGRVADRVGARRSTVATLLVSAAALAALALAPTYPWLVVAAGLAGLGNAACNPATNKVIALHVPLGSRGVVTGIKQSGVQAGTFLGGVTLPPLAARLGWRWALGVFVAVFLASWVASLKVVPRDSRPGGSDPRPAPGGRLPGFIYRLAGYGFLLGAGGSTIFTFLPLYGQEVLRLSAQTTGLAVGLMGLVGVVARIYWARSAELSLGSVRALRAIAWLAAAAAGALLVAPRLGPVGLWVGAALTGVSASAWNSVGMLAIIESLPPVAAGRGSGVVLLGFLAGLAVGAPAFGWSIDRIGVYEPGWLVVGLVFLAGWVLLRRTVAPSVVPGPSAG
jgi:MFS family permease